MAAPVLAYSASSWLAAFSSTTHTLSVTIPSGLTDAILVITKSRNKSDFANGFSSITVNGSSSGITTQVTNAVAANISHRIWTLVNPTAGTYNITLTFSTTSDDSGLLTAQVWTGVDVSGTPVAAVNSGSSGSGATPQSLSLAATGEKVAIAAYSAFSGTSLTGGGGQTDIANSNNAGASYAAGVSSLSYSWSGTSPTQHSSVGIVLNPAPVLPDLSGEAVLAGITADGSMAPQPDSSLDGEAVLAGITADGGMGLAPGVITTPVLKNNTGTVLASVTGIVANVYNASTGALVVRKAGLSSDGSGVVTISDVLLSVGTTYAYEIDLSATSQGRRLPTGVAA